MHFICHINCVIIAVTQTIGGHNMWEDGYVTYEIEKDDFDLLCNTFANEMCSWITIEVLKVVGKRLEQIGAYPGTHFCLLAPKNHPECVGVNILLHPISEGKVLINCIETGHRNVALSPEEAVEFILNL